MFAIPQHRRGRYMRKTSSLLVHLGVPKISQISNHCEMNRKLPSFLLGTTNLCFKLKLTT